MFLAAKGNTLLLEGKKMDYIAFGTGEKNLIMLPGLGDGVRTVKGTAIPFAWMYRTYAKEYRVYVFSRKQPLEPGSTTLDMAQDVLKAMDMLKIKEAFVLGVSMGGMIAQYLAIIAPNRIKKLVLAVTAARSNPIMQETVERWITLAGQQDYKAIMLDTARKSYSDEYLKKNHLFLPFLAMTGRKMDYERFIVLANACLMHDVYLKLSQIKCPVLILGGKKDKIVGAQASVELTERIENSALYLYEEFGHAAYEEAGDFHERVLNFFAKNKEKNGLSGRKVQSI